MSIRNTYNIYNNTQFTFYIRFFQRIERFSTSNKVKKGCLGKKIKEKTGFPKYIPNNKILFLLDHILYLRTRCVSDYNYNHIKCYECGPTGFWTVELLILSVFKANVSSSSYSAEILTASLEIRCQTCLHSQMLFNCSLKSVQKRLDK